MGTRWASEFIRKVDMYTCSILYIYICIYYMYTSKCAATIRFVKPRTPVGHSPLSCRCWICCSMQHPLLQHHYRARISIAFHLVYNHHDISHDTHVPLNYTMDWTNLLIKIFCTILKKVRFIFTNDTLRLLSNSKVNPDAN